VLATASNVKKPIDFSELRTDLQCFSKSQVDKQTVKTSILYNRKTLQGKTLADLAVNLN